MPTKINIEMDDYLNRIIVIITSKKLIEKISLVKTTYDTIQATLTLTDKSVNVFKYS